MKNAPPPNLGLLSDEEKRKLLISLLQESRKTPVLSVTQERMWQLSQISPGNPVYNFQSALAMTGPLDHAALSQALAWLVSRHDPLRTRYGVRQGKPHLEVEATIPANITFVDWRSRPVAERPAALQVAATAAAQVPFLLEQPPLFSLHCYQMEDEHHVLVLTMHHIVSDLLSLDLFFSELGSHYGAILNGATTPATPPVWIYQDHARQEQADRAALKQSPAARFWRDHLAHAPSLSWRSDFPRPAKPTGKAATSHLTLDAETVQAVEALARQERVTPFVVLLGAYYVMQWAITGSDDQLVGVPWANRNRQEVQQLIGMFSSPCPMRVGLASHTVFRELLMSVRQTVLGITEHASLPLADVVEIAQEASDGKPIMMRSMFSYVSRMKSLTFPGVDIERVPTDRGVSDLDLFLTVYVDGACWRGVFEYSTDLFSPGMAAALGDAYTAIVRTVAGQPAKTVADLASLVPLPRELQIAVAATFTADPLEEVARFWARELRWPTQMIFAPYNQVFQALLDPASELHKDGNALNALLIRPEDWIRYQEGSALRRETVAKTTGELIDAVRQAKLSAPVVIYLCPGSPDTPDRDAITAAEHQIEAALIGAPGVTVLRADRALASYAITEVHDARTDGIGHIPFTREWFSALGTELVRRATGRQRTPLKVIALDCDNTLWRGVAGEDGALGVKVDGPYRALQEFMAAQADAGVLLCLVSKNETEDVLRVFDQNPGFVLRRDQIAGHRINWLPKSGNLRALAAELNLGLDSFAFVDDNPVECAEVAAACPQVLTLCLPKHADDIPAFLASVWAFDRHNVTDEDRKRGKQMAQNKQRDELRAETGSFNDFLTKLALVVDAVPADDKSMPRLAQLSQRTNQFNNTGIRYDEAQLRRQLEGDLHATAVSVRDRFGDYGLVGAVFYRLAKVAIEVEGFLLSCRVLGRGVEHRLVADLGRAAQAHGRASVRIAVKRLDRNEPFFRFLGTLDGAFTDDRSAFVIATEAAVVARFDPDRHGDLTVAEASSAPTTAVSDVHVARQAALAGVAGWLRRASDIQDRLDSEGKRKRGAVGTPPQGEAEHAIAAIWLRVLRIDAVGRDDNFFEIGGNSLLLVQVNSGVIEHFAKDVPITTLFQFPTIATLAAHLGQGAKAGPAQAQVQARREQARTQMQERMRQLGGMRRR
jgi:FkbH-like protein